MKVHPLPVSLFYAFVLFLAAPSVAQIANSGRMLSSPISSAGFAYVSGKLAAADGGTVERADIALWCQGEQVQSAQPDAHGNFTVAFGFNPKAEIADSSNSWSGPSSGSRGDLSNCELRITAPGFKPDRFEVQQGSISEVHKEFGTIALHRLEASLGQNVISAKSLAVPPKARFEYAKGVNSTQARDWVKAAKHFKKATDIDHNFAQAWSDLGRAQIMMGRDKDAEASLNKAIQADPEIPSAYEALSEIAGRQQQWPNVLHWTGEGLRLNPAHGSRLWFFRSLAQYMMKNLNAAMESAARGLSLDSDHRYAGLELIQAQVLIDKGDLQGAVTHMHTFLQLRPNSGAAADVRQKIEEITAASKKMQKQPAEVDDSQAVSSIHEY